MNLTGLLSSNLSSLHAIFFAVLERYVKICHPFKYHVYVTQCTVIAALVWSWVVSIAYGLLSIVNNHWHPSLGCNAMTYLDPVFLIIGTPYNILIISAFAYITFKLMLTIRRHQIAINRNEQSLSRNKDQIKKTKLVGIMALFLFLAYLPLIVSNVVSPS